MATTLSMHTIESSKAKNNKGLAVSAAVHKDILKGV